MNYQAKLMLIAGIVLIHAWPAWSRDVFRISWRGTAYTTNQNGRVVARAYSEKEFIERYAANTGVDPRTIAVGYVHDEEEPAEELEIVDASNGASVANIFQFLGGLAVTSSDGTQTQRRRFIYDEAHRRVALGDMSGSERLRRNADGRIISFSYHGRFEFSIPEENTVYVGTFLTGRRLE
jgi:hypothetical protein